MGTTPLGGGRTRAGGTWAREGSATQLTPCCLLPLLDHPSLEPRHFVDEKVVNENHKDFMFLECILFITEVRAGRHREVPFTLGTQLRLCFSLLPFLVGLLPCSCVGAPVA